MLRRKGKGHGAHKPRIDKRSGAGAKVLKIDWRNQWHGYWAHHRISAMNSLARLLNAPLQSLLTWMVLAVAMTLPALLLLGLDNLQALGQRWDGGSQLTVFLDPRAKEQAISSYRQQLSSNRSIAETNYVPPDQALKEFEQTTGMGQALRALDTNPLPPSIVIQPAAGLAVADIEQLAVMLSADPLVDDVIYDRAWIERLHRILTLGQQLVLLLGGLLALGAVLVIGNTIRLTIESRRDEIIIIKLVGGTNAFVRRPFLYTGFWYGLGGGVLALLLLLVLIGLLSNQVTALAAAYQSNYQLQGLGWNGSLLLLLGAISIGWLGAWLAVSRHLSSVEPK